ncbi:MAG TPA: IS1595 family transposase, partial [Prolixibacteraceae bacterium]|nr:IS1595 family transposase [Prolixibacteraceae bacterium]
IKGANLQRYLNEFVYKLNRRYCKSIFERLIVASVFPYWYNND